MKKTVFRIGRDPGCDIPVADDSMSRVHAEIELTADGKLAITDRGSSNGTFLVRGGQQERITRAVAGPADTVVFGSCQFEVAELIADVRARSPEPAAPKRLVPAPDDKAKRIRCAECGFVKVQGQSCPRCASRTRRG
ncbi:MAG: FHA domain-containing protein [Myxococcales bacterium]|nr:FHA domain-containing protein [Myxococcales bacterium]